MGLGNKQESEAARLHRCLTFPVVLVSYAGTALLSSSVQEKASTHLLLGMCLDTYARYLLFSKQPSQAQRMYEKALQISEEMLGERHPQVREESGERSVKQSCQCPGVRCCSGDGVSVNGPSGFLSTCPRPSLSPPPGCLLQKDLRAADRLSRVCT